MSARAEMTAWLRIGFIYANLQFRHAEVQTGGIFIAPAEIMYDYSF